MLNRRNIIAGAATLPVATISAFNAPPAIACDDPVFAAIEHHRAAWAACDAPGDEEVSDVDVRKYQRAEAELLGTAPVTFAGLLAVLTYLDEGLDGVWEPDTGLLVGSLLRGCRAMTAPAAVRQSNGAPEVVADPIFAAIERHSLAWQAFESAAHEDGEVNPPSVLVCSREQWEKLISEGQNLPQWPTSHNELRLYRGSEIDHAFAKNPDLRDRLRAELAEIKRKCRPIKARCEACAAAQKAARVHLAETAPTTAAGVAALLHYVRCEEDKCGGDDFFEEDERAEFYGSLAIAAKRIETTRAA